MILVTPDVHYIGLPLIRLNSRSQGLRGKFVFEVGVQVCLPVSVSLCVLHMCTVACSFAHTWKPRRTFDGLLYHCLCYSLELGSLTEPGSRLVIRQAPEILLPIPIVLGLQVNVTCKDAGLCMTWGMCECWRRPLVSFWSLRPKIITQKLY